MSSQTKTILGGYSIKPPVTGPIATTHYNIGNMIPGHYRYKVTYYTGMSETTASNPSNEINIDNTTSSVILSNIPISTSNNVLERIIYRTKHDGSTYYKLASIKNNTTTEYLDLADDSELIIEEPTVNNAFSYGCLNGWIEFQRPIIHGADIILALAPNSGQLLLTAEHNIVACPIDYSEVYLPAMNIQYMGCRIVVSNITSGNRLVVINNGIRSIINPGKIAEFIASRSTSNYNVYDELSNNNILGALALEDFERMSWQRIDDQKNISFIEASGVSDVVVTNGSAIAFPTITQQSTICNIVKQTDTRYMFQELGTYEVSWSATVNTTAIYLNSTIQSKLTRCRHIINIELVNTMFEIRNISGNDLNVDANINLIIRQI